MGVINVTPDSFSGDGIGGKSGAAADMARSMERDGADILDLGAESSRPNGEQVSEEEELRRLIPALCEVRAATELPLSVDTWRSGVASAAVREGADLINDIHGLRRDGDMAKVAADLGVPVIAMHNQRGMPVADVVTDIRAGLDKSLAAAAAAGIGRENIILDPGFGFGWSPGENLEMLRRLPELWGYQLPLLAGVSRKSTLGAVLDAPVDARVEATISAVAICVALGVDLVRVHDVAAISSAVRIADAIVRGNWRDKS